jgi:hypothetical protein
VNDTQRSDARVAAYLACVALVREAVAHQRAHAAARRMTSEQRQADPSTWRLPDLDLVSWYERAGAAVDALEATDG